LSGYKEGAFCEKCNVTFAKNTYGFLEMLVDSSSHEIKSTTDDYASNQIANGDRVFEEYLMPYFKKESFSRVLDVGCGIGRGTAKLKKMGYEAYGIDLPNLSPYWNTYGNDPDTFICGDVSKMPFPDNYFDIVSSLGVIEHIGTTDGHDVLSSNYEEARLSYAKEIVRVTKPGGRIVIACPNKSFPVDMHHGFHKGLRGYVFNKTGLHFHRTWGKNYLLSYAETKKLFCQLGGSGSMYPLPLRNYFGFSKFEKGLLKPFAYIAKFYIDNLPTFLRSSFVNPYMFAEFRK
jgi:SAM-dependent methyltransferase